MSGFERAHIAGCSARGFAHLATKQTSKKTTKLVVSVDADAAEAVPRGGRGGEATGTGSQARIRGVSIVLGGGEGGGWSGLGLQRWAWALYATKEKRKLNAGLYKVTLSGKVLLYMT